MRFSNVGLSLLFAISSLGKIANAFTAQEIQYILDDHNTARRTLATPVANNMLLLMWDPILAQVAQNYANSCDKNSFSHNSQATTQYQAAGGTHATIQAFNYAWVGENWYSGAATNLTDNVLFGGATNAWTKGGCEGGSFSGSTATCTFSVCSEMQGFYQTGTVNGQACTQSSGDFGHFTQVMWAATQYVGCGYSSQCGTVCDYAQGGNFNLPQGTQVASDIWGTGGAAASKCPSFAPYNDNGLCSPNSPNTAAPVTQTPTTATATAIATTKAAASTSSPTTVSPTTSSPTSSTTHSVTVSPSSSAFPSTASCPKVCIFACMQGFSCQADASGCVSCLPTPTTPKPLPAAYVTVTFKTTNPVNIKSSTWQASFLNLIQKAISLPDPSVLKFYGGSTSSVTSGSVTTTTAKVTIQINYSVKNLPRTPTSIAGQIQTYISNAVNIKAFPSNGAANGVDDAGNGNDILSAYPDISDAQASVAPPSDVQPFDLNNNQDDSNNGLSLTWILVIAGAGLLLLVSLVGLFIFMRKRREAFTLNASQMATFTSV